MRFYIQIDVMEKQTILQTNTLMHYRDHKINSSSSHIDKPNWLMTVLTRTSISTPMFRSAWSCSYIIPAMIYLFQEHYYNHFFVLYISFGHGVL